MTASEILSVALSALADRRLRTPCQNPRTRDRWTADNHEDREYAVAACRSCPVLPECRAAAEQMKERLGRLGWRRQDPVEPTTEGDGRLMPRRTHRRPRARRQSPYQPPEPTQPTPGQLAPAGLSAAVWPSRGSSRCSRSSHRHGGAPMTPRDPSLFVIALSAEVSGHVAVAVQEHLRACKRRRLATPPELPDLVRELANRATRGQEGSPLEDLWQVRQSQGMSSKLVSYADAATVLGVSPTTVKRLVRSGELTAVHILGAARLRVCDIDEYIETLAQNTSTPNPKEVA